MQKSGYEGWQFPLCGGGDDGSGGGGGGDDGSGGSGVAVGLGAAGGEGAGCSVLPLQVAGDHSPMPRSRAMRSASLNTV